MLEPAQARLERWVSAKKKLVWAALLLGLAMLYLATASDELGGGLGGDDAQYLLLARALAQGQGYVDLYLPRHPPHTKYPPLFPILLAPFTWLGPDQLYGSHLFLALLALVAPLALAGWTRRQGYSETAALGVLLLAATLPRYYQFLLGILSEIPFMAFCYVALWRMARAGPRPSSRDLLIVTAAALAALFTRTAGIALVAAIGLELVRRPEFRRLRFVRLPGFVFFGATVVLVFGAWMLRNRMAGGSGLGYFQEFLLKDVYHPDLGRAGFADLLGRAFTHAYFYLTLLAMQVALGNVFYLQEQIPIYFFPLLIPIAAGWISRLRRPDRSAEGFFLFSALMMSAWWYKDDRFVIPLLPLAGFYLALGVRHFFGWLLKRMRLSSPSTRARALTAGAGLAILLHQTWIVAGQVQSQHADRLEPQAPVYLSGYGTWAAPVINWAKYDRASMTEYQFQLLTRIQIIYRVTGLRVLPGRVILSRKPTLTSYFADRPSLCYLFTEDVRAQWDLIRQNQVSYFQVRYFDRESQALFDSCRQCFRMVVGFPEGYPAVYEIVAYPDAFDNPGRSP
jgi:hypothetical protein